jgi:hypothetical protein
VTVPGRLAVIVPTTGAALRLLTLAPRPGLPHGAAFAEGDYRPLALSPDYRALAGPEGPIARHLGQPIPPHELRLSGAPETGRSWEAPLALAHLLLARGWSLTADPAEADLTLWATGAVDLDLALLPGDYAPERKAMLSLDILKRARSGTVAVLPPGPGRDEAAAIFRQADIRVLLPETLAEVLAELNPTRHAPPAEPSTRPAPKAPTKSFAAHTALWTGALGATAALALAVGLFDPMLGRISPAPSPTPDLPQPVVALDPEEVGSKTTDTLTSTDPSGETPEPPIKGVSGDETETEPATDPPAEPEPEAATPAPAAKLPPPITLSEIHAAPGATCRSALFDPAQRILKPLDWTTKGFAPTTFTPTLCGIALVTADGTPPPVPTATPPGALLDAGAPLGSLHLFLRLDAQNLVYTFPDPREGATAPLTHEIQAPN